MKDGRPIWLLVRKDRAEFRTGQLEDERKREAEAQMAAGPQRSRRVRGRLLRVELREAREVLKNFT